MVIIKRSDREYSPAKTNRQFGTRIGVHRGQRLVLWLDTWGTACRYQRVFEGSEAKRLMGRRSGTEAAKSFIKEAESPPSPTPSRDHSFASAIHPNPNSSASSSLKSVHTAVYTVHLIELLEIL